MKLRSPPFIGWRGLVTAITISLGWLFAPAFCQNPNVALLLQQTPSKGGVTTPTAGVYHFDLNSEVTLVAVPKPGYQFVYWLGDVSDPSATSTLVYLNKPKIIVAVFEETEYGGLLTEGSPSGGGGAGGGMVRNAVNFGHTGGMSTGAGGKKSIIHKHVYPEIPEVIPEPSTVILLALGSLFAFTRRRAKGRNYSNL
jgi:hypothetical protein